MSKKYIDIKVTLWMRYHLDDNADVPVIIEDLKNGMSLDECLEKQNLFESDHFEYTQVEGTEEFLAPEENNGQATLEIFDETANEMMPVYSNEILILKN
jgi:hypothetical protein